MILKYRSLYNMQRNAIYSEALNTLWIVMDNRANILNNPSEYIARYFVYVIMSKYIKYLVHQLQNSF